MTEVNDLWARQYLLAWAATLLIGRQRLKKLTDFFPDLKTAWQADFFALLSAGFDEKTAAKIKERQKQIDPEKEWEKIIKAKVSLLALTDPDYPPLLKQISRPPILLFYQGDLNGLAAPTLAVVGTRQNSWYGEAVIKKIIPDLVAQNITIISGLAQGIDALAHRATLNANGKTIAVLGNGLNRQTTNIFLMKKIIERGGAVISEYPLDFKAEKYTFPQRNRLIAGLSLGTLVVEAPEKSGALITAYHALEQNREVFAAPGNINSPNAAGANNLIKNGAKLVNGSEDILVELNLATEKKFQPALKIFLGSGEEEKIIQILNQGKAHVDKIIKLSKININVLLSALSNLELKGIIQDLGGKNYILVK